MKVFISASPGVGKSAVVAELVKRGYAAYDTDDTSLGLTMLINRKTGESAERPKGYINWHHYAWIADEARLKIVLDSAETVIMAGLFSNQEKFFHYFDTLIALSITPEEHERRLRSRPPREFGDFEQNIVNRLKEYPVYMEKFRRYGFTTIDNSGSLDDTVLQIQKMLA